MQNFEITGIVLGTTLRTCRFQVLESILCDFRRYTLSRVVECWISSLAWLFFVVFALVRPLTFLRAAPLVIYPPHILPALTILSDLAYSTLKRRS